MLNFAKFDQSGFMIKSFISLVAKDILQFTKGELKDVAVIFPNRRAGSVFRNELVAQMQNPSWSPGIFSVDDWLTDLSGLRKTEKLENLALLFPIVKKHLPHVEVFADFIDLGETLLADFEDTDKYLADPLKLFATLREVKKIDSLFDVVFDEELVERVRVFWSGFGAGQSTHQEKWLQIWECLYPIYQEFNESLGKLSLGTSGMCYRKAAEDLISGRINTGRYKKLVFAGFNILTNAEEIIFKFLKDSGVALFYWDYNSYYLKSPNEAGKFLQQYLKNFPPPAGFEPFPEGAWDFLNSTDSRECIKVIPVTSNSGQVQSLLNDLKKRPEANRGIILSDEGLFSDLLSSWPDDSLPVNFTSGYPLRNTLAAGLFQNLSDIFLDSCQSLDKGSCKSDLILKFLQHPWAKWLTGDSTKSFIDQVQRRYPDEVPAHFINSETGISPWIGKLVNTADFIDRIKALCVRLEAYRTLYYPVEQAAIELITAQATVLKELIDKFNLPLDPLSIWKIWIQFLNSSKITLETDRDACNQVTGILETRLMDFDEVFILSFNEGIWPSKSLPGSLIPYSLRKIFHLPTAENRDAMYAYYFYRLIQRTKSLNIYYLTGHRDDGIRSGEKSRYITQLQFETARQIEIRAEPPARVGDPSLPIIIQKEGAVKELLFRYLANDKDSKSLSPSALNEYLDCSLKFALKRIYQMREPDDIAYASEPKGFGILIHQVMNLLYSEFVGKVPGPDNLWFKETLTEQERLAELIRREYNLVLKQPGTGAPGGKEILGMEVVRQFINSILEFDKKELSLTIRGLEKDYRMQYPIEIGGVAAAVNLNGIIDRIDRIDDGVRIVDYKTGNCDLNAKSVGEMFNRNSSKRPKEAFQVLLYCELFLHNTKDASDIMPSLFRPGRFRSGDHDHRVQLDGNNIVYEKVRSEFTAGLRTLLEDLFNPEIPFVQCEDEQVCKFCPYAGICSREAYS